MMSEFRRMAKKVCAFGIVFGLTPIVVRAQGTPAKITSVAGTEGCGNLTADPAGNLYFVDEQANFRKMAAGTGKITIAAKPAGSLGGGIAVDAAGDLYIANFDNRVVKVTAATGVITTVAGTGASNNGVTNRIPGPATQAIVDRPGTLALDSAGNLFIGHVGGIWKVTASTGVITGVSISPYPTKRGDPVDTIPGMNLPMVRPPWHFDGDGNMCVAESGRSVVWKVPAAGGMLKRVAGTGVQGYSGDGLPATQAKVTPGGVGV